jgi:hypothetical protein
VVRKNIMVEGYGSPHGGQEGGAERESERAKEREREKIPRQDTVPKDTPPVTYSLN